MSDIKGQNKWLKPKTSFNSSIISRIKDNNSTNKEESGETSKNTWKKKTSTLQARTNSNLRVKYEMPTNKNEEIKREENKKIYKDEDNNKNNFNEYNNNNNQKTNQYFLRNRRNPIRNINNNNLWMNIDINNMFNNRYNTEIVQNNYQLAVICC